MIEGANGKIHWATSPVPNRLVAVNRASGGRTEVTYTASSQQATGQYGNQIPTVQQLVSQIVDKDGRGTSRTTSYTYANGKYDFINRKALGYDTVTAQLEPVAGETVGPVVTTLYLNNNFVDSGLVASQLVTVGGTTTWSKLNNSWTLSGPSGWTGTTPANGTPESGGPFKIEKTKERVATLQGDQLIETMREFGYDAYGQIVATVNYGFSSNGTNIATTDDVTERSYYQPNLTAYIVNRPSGQRLFKGIGLTSDISVGNMAIWLRDVQFLYDGAASASVAPAEGNTTAIKEWTGNTTTFALEALNRFECYFLNTMQQLNDYLDEVNHPHVQGMYDTFHCNIEEKDPVGAIRTIRPRLRKRGTDVARSGSRWVSYQTSIPSGAKARRFCARSSVL